MIEAAKGAAGDGQTVDDAENHCTRWWFEIRTGVGVQINVLVR